MEEEIDSRLNKLDSEFIAQGLPEYLRPSQAFRSIYGNLPDGPARESLFDYVVSWFFAKYHERIHWDGIVGRVPVLIRGDVYLLSIPAIPANLSGARLTLLDWIEDLPNEIAEAFTPEEFEPLARRIARLTPAFTSLYNLEIDSAAFDEEEKGLLRRARFDLGNAAYALRISGDTQTAIFQAHAAAEKLLKLSLKRSGSNITLKSLQHNLPKIFNTLVAVDSRYGWLKSSVDALQESAPSMQIRYGVVPRTTEDAIAAFNASLNVCGTLAQIWLMEFARGSKASSFEPGKFYTDAAGAGFYCKEVLQGSGGRFSAVLARFGMDPLTGRNMVVVIQLDSELSAFYLEVRDERLKHEFRNRFEWHLRNCRTPVSAEHLGIQIASGPEGSGVTRLIRTKIV
ncbi:MAG TPA: HEPN domain-containing protein [Bryobacteraceae bacterium]